MTESRKIGLRFPVVHTAWAMVATISLLLGAIAVPGVEDSKDGHNAFVADVLRVTNAERTARGLGTVSENEVLQRAAQWMAEDLAARDTLNHTDSWQRGLAKRLGGFGYENARLLAENIAEGQATPTAVVNSWMQSPPHRGNLLHPEVREAGVGHAINGRGHHYWVLDLGTRFNHP